MSLCSPFSSLSGFSSLVLLSHFSQLFSHNVFFFSFIFSLYVFTLYHDFSHHQTKYLNPVIQSYISNCSLQVYTGYFINTSNICCCSATKSCLALCNPTDYSKSDFPVLHYLSELAQTHVCWVGDAIQPSHPLSPSPPLTLNLSLDQGLFLRGFPGGSDSKESACNARDLGSFPGSGRSPGEGNGYPLQYSCLENSMDRGTWQATVLEVTKSRTQHKI